MATFKDLNLSPAIAQVLDQMGFTQPTEIQAKAIPLLLTSDHIDFHGQAQTGTGKTLAFGIPLLQRINPENKNTQALIVAPTRELAVQIYESLERIARALNIKIAVIYGGVSMEEQMRKLKSGVQVVVGTPGRLNDHLRRKTLSIEHISTLVLDEADIMLDMGFKDEIDEILSFAPKNRQIWLFSATVKQGISDIMKKHMQDTVSVRVSQKQVGSQSTKQYYCIVPFRSRLHAVTRFIQSVPNFYGFIFCQTKILASEVADQLTKRGYSVGALHGDLSQAQRNIVIKKFKQQEFTILVATDVAARGIDVADVSHVINYSIPEDLESYVHRVGRTGRAGKEGTAITFVSKSEVRIINQVERKFNLVIAPIDVPSVKELLQARLKQVRSYLDTIADQQGYRNEELEPVVKDLSAEKLKDAVTCLLFNKFLSTLDLEDIPYTPAESTQDQLQEISVSIGSDDGIEKDMVINYLVQTGVVTQEQIKSVRVLKHRTFVKLEGDCTPNLLEAVRGKFLEGRKVHVSMTCLIGQPFREQRRRMERRPDRDGGYRRRSGDRDRYSKGSSDRRKRR